LHDEHLSVHWLLLAVLAHHMHGPHCLEFRPMETIQLLTALIPVNR